MTTHPNREGLTQRSKAKALAAGVLVAAMLIAGTMVAIPARAATTFTVNNTSDAPDASLAGTACDTDVFTNGDQCSLRAAIQQANATAGADTINFAILGTSVKTIAVGATGLGALPEITDPVTIDGYTQPGASPNTRAVGNDAALKVQLDGTDAGSGASGLDLDGGASNSVIRGLVINRFSFVGVDVFSSSGGASTGVRIQGNFIGTDPTGTLDRGNGNSGVAVFSNDISGTLVGGTTPADRNLISGNGLTGVDMGDTSFDNVLSQSVRVQGNYIGTDRSGTKDLGNGFDGIFLEFASGATIGGTTAASRNVVSGNGFAGLDLFSDTSTQVLGNRIGTTASGTGALGNDRYGVVVEGPVDRCSCRVFGDGTSAGSNTIAFNGQDGVFVGSGIGNKISRNSIFSNGGLGIDLRGPGETETSNVSTANDPGDADTGPNALQNFPVLTSARTVSGKTTIKGTLNTNPNDLYVLQFYSNPSGNEGKKFIGQTSVKTDASGNVSFTFSPANAVSVGQTVTATSTRSANLNTSEFSASRKVTK